MYCHVFDEPQCIYVNSAHRIARQVLDHVMVGIEGITNERGHHLIRERCDIFQSPFSL